MKGLTAAFRSGRAGCRYQRVASCGRWGRLHEAKQRTARDKARNSPDHDPKLSPSAGPAAGKERSANVVATPIISLLTIAALAAEEGVIVNPYIFVIPDTTTDAFKEVVLAFACHGSAAPLGTSCLPAVCAVQIGRLNPNPWIRQVKFAGGLPIATMYLLKTEAN
ncbi:unnamed protein product [Phytophthora fragariaefolia]|uniref:Unnamed protein product n=1 Tax=Phytophthora fragariaefolia TaxID=1490495 RepID=A0A9W7CVB2_9STRA|nr:unnamed protein product [Phytophthora fragariaefolia]